jgi:hypothetical protein
VTRQDIYLRDGLVYGFFAAGQAEMGGDVDIVMVKLVIGVPGRPERHVETQGRGLGMPILIERWTSRRIAQHARDLNQRVLQVFNVRNAVDG